MPNDPEIEALRAGVNCAAVLESMVSGWTLDARHSTRRALKYRRGPGEILIVNHDGKGWWDPFSDAKGDVFDLVQHLDPALNFGHVRQVLRRFIGVAPNLPAMTGATKQSRNGLTVGERWARRPHLRRGSATWNYLTEERALTDEVITAAAAQDVLREGPDGSAWFAHRRGQTISHVEIRGPEYKGSLAGGEKTLFSFRPDRTAPRRLVIAEAPIDALSVAVLEKMPADTHYAATGGGMGPATIEALEANLRNLAPYRNGLSLAASAADANPAGDRYAERHAELAANAGVSFVRLRPPDDLDWNDVLQNRRKP